MAEYDYTDTTEGWGIRTVKNGRVKLFGKYYVPDEKHRPYNGELEGVRGCFYKYKFCHFIAFWGTLRMYDDDYDINDEPNIINGKIYWSHWNEQEAQDDNE